MSSSLLPDKHENFRLKSYWHEFFSKRNKEAFEWYGSFIDVKKHFLKLGILKPAKILVIGCGNSELSSCLYKDGYENITNMDFEESVIQEMSDKYSQQLPKMKWVVADMTNMKEFSTAYFDVVLDKGALDALMSSNSEACQIQATQTFNEINRVLNNIPRSANDAVFVDKSVTGVYMCISLLEPYILRALLAHYNNSASCGLSNSEKLDIQTLIASGSEVTSDNLSVLFKNQASTAATNVAVDWTVEIQLLQYNKSVAELSQLKLCPFCVNMIRKSTNNIDNVPKIHYFIDGCGVPMKKPLAITDIKEASVQVLLYQELHDRRVRLSKISPDKFEEFQFFQKYSESNENVAFFYENIPRFTVTLVDILNLKSTRNCAVFLIPIGREMEYQFSSKEGLKEIALSAQCKRLFAVRMNRPHVFDTSNMPAIQSELNPIITSLLPIAEQGFSKDESIPYMALDQDHSWSVIYEGKSELSGPFIVEEKEIQESSVKSKKNKEISKLRRLIFLQNQNFVQTELKMKCVNDSYRVDTNSVDSHHMAMLLGYSFSRILSSSESSLNSAQGVLIVGLGGGILSTVLSYYLPESVVISCEWDAEVVNVSKLLFGYTDLPIAGTAQLSAGKYTVIMDGIKVLNYIMDARKDSESPSVPSDIQAISKLKLSMIVLDVDGKDHSKQSLEIAAPPLNFITNEQFVEYYSLLDNGGCLMINSVCRTDNALNELLHRVSVVFDHTQQLGRVFLIKPSSENVNVVIVAVKTNSNLYKSEGKQGKLKKSGKALSGENKLQLNDLSGEFIAAMNGCITSWLKALHISNDPIGLLQREDVLISEVLNIN